MDNREERGLPLRKISGPRARPSALEPKEGCDYKAEMKPGETTGERKGRRREGRERRVGVSRD